MTLNTRISTLFTHNCSKVIGTWTVEVTAKEAHVYFSFIEIGSLSPLPSASLKSTERRKFEREGDKEGSQLDIPVSKLGRWFGANWDDRKNAWASSNIFLDIKYVLTISDASWGEDLRKGAVLPGGAPHLLRTVRGRRHGAGAQVSHK